jgi:ribosomal-protein-alanine N-acetyltransferase
VFRSLRLLTADDRAAFVEASRRSRALHGPWVAPPLDTRAFRRHLARFDGVHGLGFVVLEPDTGALGGRTT